MICTQQLGKCTDEDRSAVQTWLQGKGLEAVVVTELFDLWYGEPALISDCSPGR